MPRYVEDLDRDRDDADGQEREFLCPWCNEALDLGEGLFLERHPERLFVCLDCACSG